MLRYPSERTEYCKNVGKTRVENIAEILRSLEGFDVIIKDPEAHDVDIWVFKEDVLVLVIEVLNWKRTAYLDFNRTRRIQRNLTNPDYNDVGKLLVFSFMSNIENQINSFDGLNIDFLEIGFQTQPVRYFIWFFNRREARDMMPKDRSTKEIVRRKLLNYLRKKDLI